MNRVRRLLGFDPTPLIGLAAFCIPGGVVTAVAHSFLAERYGQGPVMTAADNHIMIGGFCVGGLAILLAIIVMIFGIGNRSGKDAS